MSPFLESLRVLPITVDRPDAERVMPFPELAFKHQLTAYGAAHLELSLRLNLAIATKDGAMKRAVGVLRH